MSVNPHNFNVIKPELTQGFIKFFKSNSNKNQREWILNKYHYIAIFMVALIIVCKEYDREVINFLNLHNSALNWFLSLIALLLLFIVLFDILFIRAFCMSEKNWKIAEFIWFFVASFTLITFVTQLNEFFKVSEDYQKESILKVEYSYFLSDLNNKSLSMYCKNYNGLAEGVKLSEVSPKTKFCFKYDLLFNEALFKVQHNESIGIIQREDYYHGSIDTEILNVMDTVTSSYNEYVKLVHEYSPAPYNNPNRPSVSLILFASAMFTIALALRITKILADLHFLKLKDNKTEKGRYVNLNIYNSNNPLLFNPNTQFFKLPILWIFISLILIVAFVITQSIISNTNLDLGDSYSSSWFNNIVEKFQVPIGILALLIPIIAILNANHRSEQAKKQIEINQEQNIFANHYKHLDSFKAHVEEIIKSHNLMYFEIISIVNLHKCCFPKSLEGIRNLDKKLIDLINYQLSTLYNSLKSMGESDKTQISEKLLLELISPINVIERELFIINQEDKNKLFKIIDNAPVNPNTFKDAFENIQSRLTFIKDILDYEGEINNLNWLIYFINFPVEDSWGDVCLEVNHEYVNFQMPSLALGYSLFENYDSKVKELY